MITRGQTRETVTDCPICKQPLNRGESRFRCMNSIVHPNVQVLISFYSNNTVDSVYLQIDHGMGKLHDYYAVHVFYGEDTVLISHYINFEKKGDVKMKDAASTFPIKAYTPDQLNTYILFS